MLSYILRRLLYAALTFLGITVAVFALIHTAPGDPIEYYIGIHPTRPPGEVLEQIRAEHRLDKSLATQYLFWLKSAATLEFGRSFVDRRPVSSKIAEKLPNTFALNALALMMALGIAIPAGLAGALRARRWFDRGSGLAFLLLYSLPNFWVGLLLMQLFAVHLEVLPLYGMSSTDHEQLPLTAKVADRLAHLILPVITLAYTQLAVFARFSRSALLEVIHQDFITAARARGLSERAVVFRHAFRNALIPLITLLGLTVPYLISGSVIVEQLFQWDGVGRLYFEAVLARDYPTVMGLTVATAVVTLLASLIADLLYGLADPRIRVSDVYA